MPDAAQAIRATTRGCGGDGPPRGRGGRERWIAERRWTSRSSWPEKRRGCGNVLRGTHTRAARGCEPIRRPTERFESTRSHSLSKRERQGFGRWGATPSHDRDSRGSTVWLRRFSIRMARLWLQSRSWRPSHGCPNQSFRRLGKSVSRLHMRSRPRSRAKATARLPGGACSRQGSADAQRIPKSGLCSSHRDRNT